jgi:hypothetical protein
MSAALLENSALVSLVGGGFMAAFLHAALPTHWLPFVLVSRAQGWGPGRAIGVAALSGLAHIASTALVGALIVAAGLALDHWVEGILPYAAAALLFGFGVFYLVRSLRRSFLERALTDRPIPPRRADGAAILGLVAMMAISPGEVLLPFYLNAADLGPVALGGLTLAFAAGTVGGMSLLTGLAYAGASLLKIEPLARHEGVILGLALIGLSLLMVLRPH